MTPPLVFKIASDPHEFEQIERLNYRTFVEEIPQHAANADGRLRDKFHDENTYVVALREDRLVGMIALRDRRPFSLDGKLPDLDRYLPPARRPCEIRLLSVADDERKTPVFLGLAAAATDYCRRQAYDLALISGTTRQTRLYRRVGFVPFGPLVGTPGAEYQPMYLTPETFDGPSGGVLKEAGRLRQAAARVLRQPRSDDPVNLLPGPVAIAPAVREAFTAPPVSHRAPAFVEELQSARDELRTLVRSHAADILVGTGTLANDVIAGQLSLADGPGLILSNGEFGERLLDHAARFRLPFTPLHRPWGTALESSDVERALDASSAAWLWAAHCETSTGVLHDLDMLKAACAARAVRLCLDCVSSVGTVPLDLSGVHLASASSGKGLGSYPGLAIVFRDHDVSPAPDRLPRYLDLGLYATADGSPFTHSSNLLAALRAALRTLNDRRYAATARLAASLRANLRAAGFTIIAPEPHASPAATTIALPPEISSEAIGRRLEAAGYRLSYRSAYLLRRNWTQICLMADYPVDRIEALPELLRRACSAAVSLPR